MQWHLVEDDPTHLLTHVELLWVGHTNVVRVRGDWDDGNSAPSRTQFLSRAATTAVAYARRERRPRIVRI